MNSLENLAPERLEINPDAFQYASQFGFDILKRQILFRTAPLMLRVTEFDQATPIGDQSYFPEPLFVYIAGRNLLLTDIFEVSKVKKKILVHTEDGKMRIDDFRLSQNCNWLHVNDLYAIVDHPDKPTPVEDLVALRFEEIKHRVPGSSAFLVTRRQDDSANAPEESDTLSEDDTLLHRFLTGPETIRTEVYADMPDYLADVFKVRTKSGMVRLLPHQQVATELNLARSTATVYYSEAKKYILERVRNQQK